MLPKNRNNNRTAKVTSRKPGKPRYLSRKSNIENIESRGGPFDSRTRREEPEEEGGGEDPGVEVSLPVLQSDLCRIREWVGSDR